MFLKLVPQKMIKLSWNLILQEKVQIENATDIIVSRYWVGTSVCTRTQFLRKTKKGYSYEVNPKLVSDNNIFWQITKAYFSKRDNVLNKIMILRKCIIYDDRRISWIFIEHFINVTKTSDLKPRKISSSSFPEI